jgi:hypothetical protein
MNDDAKDRNMKSALLLPTALLLAPLAARTANCPRKFCKQA